MSPPDQGPRRLAGLRVLLVEDVADVRDVLALLLRLEGASVVATGSGREATELVRRAPFDVVLTDYGLPDLPGDVLIRQLRAAATVRPLRIAVLTAFDEPYLSRARQAGADAIFTKPVDWTSLLDYLGDRGLAASA